MSYRAPEAAPETEVQIQGQQTTNSTVEITDSSGAVKNATMAQNVYIGYEIIEDIDSPNVLGMFMQLDVPADILTNSSYIYQYVQYRKEFNYADDYHTVACVIQVNDTANFGANNRTNFNETMIYNYKGQEFNSAINTTDGSMQSINDTMSSDYISTNPNDGTEFFQKKSDDSLYGLD